MPQVSVVIPAYNSMAYLPDTLDSVLKQTFTNFEVLIINDGSSDNIVEWASKIIDPRVKLISQANQGASVARNTGIINAQGEYVAFLDADDLWEPTKLEKQVNCLDENSQVGLVHTWMLLIDRENKPTGRVMKSTVEGNALHRIIERNSIACSSAMVRRSCFEDLGLFDISLHFAEDWDMWIRIASGYQFTVIKESLIRYRQHPNGKSKKYFSRLEDFRNIIEKAFESIPFELLYLRNRSYGYINLIVAWKCLQNNDIDHQTINHFRRQALAHYPQICFSWEYMRLSLAMLLMRCFKAKQYTRMLKLAYALRQYISSFAG